MGILLHAGQFWFVPGETHQLFAGGFLFLGAMMTAESLAGNIWYRNPLRTMLMPSTLIILGAGLMVVVVLDPKDRLVHLAMAASVLLAGWFEYRYRLGAMSRFRTDLVMIPALLITAFEVGVIHTHGPIGSAAFSTHGVMGITTAGLALLRLYESGDLRSSFRSLLLSAGVVVLSIALLVDVRFH